MGASKVSAPAPRDYYREMFGSVRAQNMMMPEYLAADARWIPQWQELQGKTLMGQMGILDKLYSAATPMGARLAQGQIDAFAPVMGNLGVAAKGAYNQMLGADASGLLSTMQRQASNELGLGRSLSDEQRQYAEQSARAAMQARGLQGGNQAVALEVLNNYNLANEREAQRRNYAASVYGLSEASAGNAFNMYGAPLLSMISSVSPAGLVTGAGGMAGGYGPQTVQGESSYNAAMITANRKEAMDAAIANQQSSTAFKSAIIGGVAGMGGKMLGTDAAGKAIFG